MTVICYTFTTSVLPLYDFHLLMVNIEHLVACSDGLESCFYFLKLQWEREKGEQWTQFTAMIWTQNIMKNWALPGGQSEPKEKIWLKYFKCFPFNSKTHQTSRYWTRLSCFVCLFLQGKKIMSRWASFKQRFGNCWNVLEVLEVDPYLGGPDLPHLLLSWVYFKLTTHKYHYEQKIRILDNSQARREESQMVKCNHHQDNRVPSLSELCRTIT